MYNKKLPINKFNYNFLSYMDKILFLNMNYVYEACNTTILNLSINKKKDKIRIVGLQTQIIDISHVRVCNFYV